MSAGICMVTTSYPKHDGDTTAPFIAGMAEHVVQRGRRVDVVLPARRDLQAGVRAGVHLHPYWYMPFAQLRRWGYAESMEADVRLRGVAYVMAPSALAATALRTFQVAARARSGVIHAHWVIPNGPPAAQVARLLRRPLVVSLHGSDIHLAEKNQVAGRLARSAFRQAAIVTACSPDLAERAHALGAPLERLHVLPYGVSADEFRPDAAARARARAQLGLADSTVMILGLGRMVYKKGFGVAVDAMRQLRDHDVVLALAGEGDIRAELERQVAALGLSDRVIFPGAVARAEAPAWFAACDIFALPSMHDSAGNVDGLPNVLLEALAAGRAVVASDLAGVQLVLEDGKHGLIVPENDSAALAAAFARLIAAPDLRDRLGAAARRRVLDAFTWRHCADRLDALYEKALTAPRAGRGWSA